MRKAVPLLLPLLLSGCIARTALDIVTLPVKAASATVDVLTTSQAEADQKRGRELRKQEERDGKAQRRAEKQQRKRERAARDR